jgi:hypothetical protein
VVGADAVGTLVGHEEFEQVFVRFLADYCLHCLVGCAGVVVVVDQREASEEGAKEHGEII